MKNAFNFNSVEFAFDHSQVDLKILLRCLQLKPKIKGERNSKKNRKQHRRRVGKET